MQKFDIVRQAKIVNIILFAIMAATGLGLLIASTVPTLIQVVVLSVLCILVGSSKILGYMSNDLYRLAFQFDFAVGLFLIAIGVLTLIFSRDDAMNIARLFGIYVFIDGLLKIQISFDAKKFGISKWFIVLITALLVTAAGVVTLISPYRENMSLFMVVYISALVDGLVNIWVTAYTVRVRAKKKNFEERIVLDEELDK